MIWRKKEPACQDVVEVITAYLDGKLPRRDRKAFERHLAGCPHCTAYLEQMRTTVRVTGRLTEESIPADARAELMALFQDWKASRA
jgi:anti-sigma factor (TIGR02949 family)